MKRMSQFGSISIDVRMRALMVHWKFACCLARGVSFHVKSM
jgi:hypothetical protein